MNPSNILVASAEVDADVAKALRLADFGMACDVSDGPITEPGGRSKYLAPEVLLEKPHSAVSGYELLSGPGGGGDGEEEQL